MSASSFARPKTCGVVEKMRASMHEGRVLKDEHPRQRYPYTVRN